MTNGMFEDLASRLEFHFVGDSTTRRLAESFVSIVSGHAVNHEIYHENRNLFSGNLQVCVNSCMMLGKSFFSCARQRYALSAGLRVQPSS